MSNNYYNSPCQHCKERKVDEKSNCHTICPKYIEFSKQLEELKQLKHQEIESKGIIIDSVMRSRKVYRVIL